METKNKKILRSLYFIFFMIGSTTTAIDPIIPKISEDLKIGFDKIGYIFLIGSFFSLIFTLISGRLSDKFNVNNIILTGIIIMFLGFSIIGFYLSFIVLILVAVLYRSGYGIIDASIHAYTSKVYYENRSRIFIRLDVFHYLGAAASPLIISLIFFLGWDYKLIFIILAVLFLATLFLFQIAKQKKNSGADIAELSASNNEYSESYSAGINIFKVLKNRIIIFAAVIVFFVNGALFGLSSWYTTYSSTFNLPISIGSLVISLYWGLSIIGLFIADKLVKKMSEIRIIVIFYSAGVLFIACFNFVPFQFLKAVFLILTSISLTSIFPMSISLSVKERPEASGTILGFIIATAIMGILLFQPIMGVVAEFIGKGYVMFVALASAILGLIFVFILYKLISAKYGSVSKTI